MLQVTSIIDISILSILYKTGYRHVEFADTQDPLKFSPAQDPVQIHLWSTWRPHSVLEEFKTKSPETGISATTNLAEGCKKPCLCRVVVKHNEQFA